MILVDSNVLIDVMKKDPQWAPWSLGQLKLARAAGPLAINAVIHAELAASYETLAELSSFLRPAGIRLQPISAEASFLAGKAILKFRRAKGGQTGVLADFFIGAHAQSEGWSLLTRDKARYRTYFPAVTLIAP